MHPYHLVGFAELDAGRWACARSGAAETLSQSQALRRLEASGAARTGRVPRPPLGFDRPVADRRIGPVEDQRQFRVRHVEDGDATGRDVVRFTRNVPLAGRPFRRHVGGPLRPYELLAAVGIRVGYVFVRLPTRFEVQPPRLIAAIKLLRVYQKIGKVKYGTIKNGNSADQQFHLSDEATEIEEQAIQDQVLQSNSCKKLMARIG